jgi:hypothetical protein
MEQLYIRTRFQFEAIMLDGLQHNLYIMMFNLVNKNNKKIFMFTNIKQKH